MLMVGLGSWPRSWSNRSTYLPIRSDSTSRNDSRPHFLLAGRSSNATRGISTAKRARGLFCLRPFLPGGLHGILRDQRIRCEQGEFMVNGLADQHTIERVSMKRRQPRKIEYRLFLQR